MLGVQLLQLLLLLRVLLVDGSINLYLILVLVGILIVILWVAVVLKRRLALGHTLIHFYLFCYIINK